MDSSAIQNIRVVETHGDLTHYQTRKDFLGIYQTLADAQASKEVSITVDLEISDNSTSATIPCLLQKGALHDTMIRFYSVLNGAKYMLLDDVYRAGYVESDPGLNPYNFSFDPDPLFQDVAAIAARTQNEVLTGKLIFDYSSFEYEIDFPDEKGEANVFTANVEGTNLTSVANMEGFNFLKDVSPDGTRALVASAGDWNATTATLYLVDLVALNSEPVKLAEGLPFVSYQFNRSAIWVDNTKLMYIGQGEKGFGIYTMNADGTNPINIERGNPFEILAVTPERIYWSTYVQIPYLNGHKDSFVTWFTDLDTHETNQLKYKGKSISVMYHKNAVAISPDGTKIAWVDVATPEDPQDFHDYLHIASLSDIDNALTLEAGPSQIKWRLDGKSILGVGVGYIDTSRYAYGLFEVAAETATVIRNFHLGDNILQVQCSDISLDGHWLPCLTVDAGRNAEGRYPAKLILVNLETASHTEVSGMKFFLTFTPRTIIWSK
jgi:Tol biopolymer transport system component